MKLFSLLLVGSVAYATTAPVECYMKAMRDVGLGTKDAASLCKSAVFADAAIDCFKDASKLVTLSQAARLCRGTSSADWPLQCFNEATTQAGVTIDMAVELCSAI